MNWQIFDFGITSYCVNNDYLYAITSHLGNYIQQIKINETTNPPSFAEVISSWSDPLFVNLSSICTKDNYLYAVSAINNFMDYVIIQIKINNTTFPPTMETVNTWLNKGPNMISNIAINGKYMYILYDAGTIEQIEIVVPDFLLDNPYPGLSTALIDIGSTPYGIAFNENYIYVNYMPLLTGEIINKYNDNAVYATAQYNGRFFDFVGTIAQFELDFSINPPTVKSQNLNWFINDNINEYVHINIIESQMYLSGSNGFYNLKISYENIVPQPILLTLISNGNTVSSLPYKNYIYVIYYNLHPDDSITTIMQYNYNYEPPEPPLPHINPNVEGNICFKEGTKILCKLNGVDAYIPIQNIEEGTLVKTYKNGYKKCKFNMKELLKNTETHNINNLYRQSKLTNNNLFEDLYITGSHSMLYDNLSLSEETNMNNLINTYNKKFNVNIPKKIEDKHKLIAYYDNTFTEIKKDINVYIYHLVLEGNNTYGIWANGALTESIDEINLLRHFNNSKNNNMQIINKPLGPKALNKLTKFK